MQIQRMIWFAIAVSTLIYGAIVYSIAHNPAGTFESTIRNPMVLGPYVMAGLVFVIGLIWPNFNASAPPRVRMVMRLALFEACAVFGVVAAFVTHDWRIYLAPWALAVAGFIIVFPQAEAERS